jgi:hypothetical protein
MLFKFLFHVMCHFIVLFWFLFSIHHCHFDCVSLLLLICACQFMSFWCCCFLFVMVFGGVAQSCTLKQY